MSTQASAQTQNRGGQRGRRGSRGRGGNRGRGGKAEAKGTAEHIAPLKTEVEEKEESKAVDVAEAGEAEGEDAVCWICAEPVKYYALSQCGHRTCHVCALRLRALYKKMECTFCKVGCRLVVCFVYTNVPSYRSHKLQLSLRFL